MVHILTPVRAVFAGDIKIREKLLEETVQGRYPVGFEVVLVGGPQGDLTSADKIRANLERFSSNPDFYLSVHTPAEREDYTKKHTDLTTDQGLETLAKILELAKGINARLVKVHPENFHLGKELQQKDISPEEKKALQEKVKTNILRARDSTGYQGVITVECMPYPLMGDDPNIISLEATPYDPTINTAADILFFSNSGIDICIDTCHYGVTKRIVNELVAQDLLPEELKQKGILGLPYTDLQAQPSLTELARQLGGSLQCVHLSDFKGVWQLGKSSFQEGIVPGHGEYESEIRQFIKLISNGTLPINVEVGDKDFKNPLESKEATLYLLDVLSE